MDTKKLANLIIMMREGLDEIFEIIAEDDQIRSDQIRSDHDIKNRSDQIRSDQIEINMTTEDRFRDLCRRYDFDSTGIDMITHERSIHWIMENQGQIKNMKGYLQRCFPENARGKIGFRMENTAGLQRIKPIDSISEVEDDDNVFGAPIAEIQEKEPMLTEEIFRQVKMEAELDNTTIGNWEKVKNSPLKRKLVTGKAISQGLL